MTAYRVVSRGRNHWHETTPEQRARNLRDMPMVREPETTWRDYALQAVLVLSLLTPLACFWAKWWLPYVGALVAGMVRL